MMVKTSRYSFLKIGAWNIEDAYSKINNYYTNKSREEEFTKYTSDLDILCLQETHCGPHDIPTRHLTDFVSIPHCRKKSANGRFFGGMLLLVRKSIRPGVKVSDARDPEILGITLKKDFFNFTDDLHVWFTYAPPVTSPYAKSRENPILKLEAKLAGKNANHLIMGDLNGRTSDNQDFIDEETDKHSPTQDIDTYIPDSPISRRNTDTNPADTNGKLIINLCKTLQLRILNGRTPGDRWGALTRFPIHRAEKPSLIDYAICSHNLVKEVQSMYVLPFTTLSDHCCIVTRIPANFSNEENNTLDHENLLSPTTSGPRFQLSKLETYERNLSLDPAFETLLNKIRSKRDEANCHINQEDVDEWTDELANKIQENANKSFKKTPHTKSHRQTAQPKPARWYTEKCTAAKNKLKRATNRLKQDPFNRGLQEQLIAAKKEYKRTCKNAEAQHRKTLLDRLLNAEDPKDFWRQMKSMQGYGREIEDPSSCIPPKTWQEYFHKLLNKEEPQGPQNKKKKASDNVPSANSSHDSTDNQGETTEYQQRMQTKIKMDELKDAIRRLKFGKANGPDNIVAEYLRYATNNVLKTLLELMNIIFSQALYPASWSNNYLKALYKKGDADDPGNYRGLAIGSVLAKLYSTVLLNRIEVYVTTTGIISMNQIGFIKGCRTADHIYLLKTLITKYTKNRGRLYAAFIDFKKAYDTVNRDTLLRNLREYGINGKMWENIKSIYKSVTYSIKIKNKVMDPISSNLGLKQGCPLSPLLFNLYVNSITQYLQPSAEDNITIHDQKITHFMYADDLVMVGASKNSLQRKLDRLSEFAETKDLTINTKKSQVMIFNTSGKLLKDELTIKGQKLDVVSKYTYLGVDIPASGSFRTSVAELTSKAKKAMMPLFTTIMKFNLPYRTALRLFQTYIEPILLYNAENQTAMTDREITKCQQDHSHIYNIQQLSPLTTTQLKFTKFVLGVGKHCPNMTIFGESAKIPFLARAHIHMLKFWNRIKNLDEATLVNKAYRENITMNTNWCRTIQILNAKYNLHAARREPDDFPGVVKNTIYDDFIRYWKSRIENPAIEKKLTLYANTKQEFKVDRYTELPFRDRQIISKFLCVSHKLNVETGRHQQIPREERICQLCTLKKVEDEEHFICECPAYSEIRKECLGENILTEEILSMEPLALATFLRKSYNLREELLEEHPSEFYHVAQKSKLKLTLRKGPKTKKVCNLTKDGLRIKITTL